MALIQCPECGQDISDKAQACPKCGNPINMKSGPFGGFEKGVTVRPGFWHDRNVGAIGLLIILLLILLDMLTGVFGVVWPILSLLLG